jgi:hypothetical protein
MTIVHSVTVLIKRRKKILDLDGVGAGVCAGAVASGIGRQK